MDKRLRMVVSECVREAIMEEMDYDDDKMYESKRSVKRIVDECVRKAVNEAMGRYDRTGEKAHAL